MQDSDSSQLRSLYHFIKTMSVCLTMAHETQEIPMHTAKVMPEEPC